MLWKEINRNDFFQLLKIKGSYDLWYTSEVFTFTFIDKILRIHLDVYMLKNQSENYKDFNWNCKSKLL